MEIRRRYVVIIAVLTIAIVSLIAVAAAQNAEQRELIERSFVTLGRFPGAIAVYKAHEERRITESYVTPHAPDEIRAYYDQRLHEIGGEGPGPDWMAGDDAMRCYVDPTGRITAKLSTRTVPSPAYPGYGIELTRTGCRPPGS